MSKKNIWVITLLTAIAWIFIWWALGPQLGTSDIAIFKEAGISWANGNGFNAVFIPGNPTLTPKLYSSYPPFYPLLFGIFVKIFGFGPYENSFFNLVIGFTCSFLWIYFLFQIFPKNIGYLEKLLLFIILLFMPIGLSENSSDRPDTLAFTTLLVTLILSKKKNSAAIISSFFIGGISLAISPFIGIMNLALLIYLYSKDLFKKTWLLALCILVLSLTGFSLLLFYGSESSSALNRFLNHAFKEGGASRSIQLQNLSGHFNHLKSNALYLGKASIPSFTISLIFFLVTVFLLFSKKLRISNKKILIIPPLFFFICYAFFPASPLYLPICRNFTFAILLYSFYGDKNEELPLNLKKILFPLLTLLFTAISVKFFSSSYIRFFQKKPFYEMESKVAYIRSLWPKESEVIALVPANVYPLYRKHFKIIPLFLSEQKLFEELNNDNTYLKDIKIYIPTPSNFLSSSSITNQTGIDNLNFIKKNNFYLYQDFNTEAYRPLKVPLYGETKKFLWNQPIWIKK